MSDCSDSVPGSDDWLAFGLDLPTINQSLSSSKDNFTFSDDLIVLNESTTAHKEASITSRVVQHRTWNTVDIFRSEPREPPTSPAMNMATMASSPPNTPSSQRKRKLEDLDLGNNRLVRPTKAQRTYYGINIHDLLDEAQREHTRPTTKIVPTPPSPPSEPPSSRRLLWTEKYRARKFTDLIGDERTHRAVMHWLKRWDPIVFPGTSRLKAKTKNAQGPGNSEDRPHRKILLLTGPPGLGKTTLAHVCARQAGYEVQEINASDERSSAVVKGRIKDMVGTENVKGIHTGSAQAKVRKAGRPVCVVVDEVDGVVGGNSSGGGGGEGGFIKALIDLVLLDQKSSGLGQLQQAPIRKKKGERFRLLRPVILVCNDVYHPSLKPLRQSTFAEIIQVRKPAIQTITTRLHSIFQKEGVSCETDGVRRLCEAAWGVTNRKEDRTSTGAGEGDMRSIMVVGEWVAGKLRAENAMTGESRLTRRWVEQNLLRDLSHGGGSSRGLGRGGPRDIVDRVFQEGAGFPKSTDPMTPTVMGNTGVKGVAEGAKRTATERLRELVDTLGDTDRIVTDVFSAYPERSFQDDTFLSKPNAAYEWLHFHDCLSSAVFGSNDWELAPYLSTPVLAFHHLFATPTRSQYTGAHFSEDLGNGDSDRNLFTGAQASWAAHEATKQNLAHLQTLQSSLSTELGRQFTSPNAVATDLVPHLLRTLTPSVNPILVGGSGDDKSTATVRKSSEQQLVQRAVRAMMESGVRFERTRVNPATDENAAPQTWNQTQWVYRMNPPLDLLGTYETGGKALSDSTVAVKQRYAVRQVLSQELSREERRRAEAARAARNKGAVVHTGEGEPETQAISLAPAAKLVKDFFGRVITPTQDHDVSNASHKLDQTKESDQGRVWVTYHEGFSNAVRKPVSVADIMRGL